MKLEKVLDWLWFVAWGVVSSAWCLTAAGQLSATWDEPVYVARGLEHWRTGSYKGLMRLGTMPLPIDVETLPLYLYERWYGVTLDAERDFAAMLPWARAGTLVFWWLLLWYARRAGRQLAGPWAGRLAVALIACEPSFLAHATLATTDVASTACLLALVYHYRVGRDAGWWRRVVLPSGWFGAAILAKASGLAFGPLCLLAVEFERFLAADDSRRTRSTVTYLLSFVRWRDLVQITAGALIVTFVYCGCDWEAEPTFVAWANRLPEGATRTHMVWLAEHLRIFSNAGVGLVRQVTHNVRGHGAYLLGQEHPRALWYYFPVILTIKLSPPLLLAPLLVLCLRPRHLLNWALLSAAALLAFSLFCRVQIGIRFMLPLTALACAGLAAALVTTLRDLGPGRRRFLLGSSLALALAWTASSARAVWPQGLCYVNSLWGGTALGYRLVSEGNYDWGQGLKELTHWKERHGIDALDVWYYGTDPSLKSMPLHEVPLHLLPIHSPDDVPTHVRGRYLAVSTSLLYGASFNWESIRCSSAFLRACRPIGRTTTFLIYDFTREDGPR